MTTRHLIDYSRLKTGDKVICIDDTYQRVDLADAPDGLLVRGQLYCVAGVSECGGVLLAGLRAISSRSGKEVGFHPSRFCTLEDFRLKVPESDDDSDALANPRRQVEFPYLSSGSQNRPGRGR